MHIPTTQLRDAYDEQWDDIPAEDTDFRVPSLDEGTRLAAYEAVNNALTAYYAQPWYWTAYARVRFGMFWATYWLRMKLAMFLVMRLGWDDAKTWRKLGL